ENQYQAAIEADPAKLIARISLASLYVAWGKKDQAVRTLEEAKTARPNDPAAYTLVGDFYVSNGDWEKAYAEFKSLNAQHPNDVNVKKRYIQFLLGSNQFDAARKLSDEILAQNSSDGEALLDKGRALLMAEKPAEALPVLEAAVNINPYDPSGHFYMGLAYYRTGSI